MTNRIFKNEAVLIYRLKENRYERPVVEYYKTFGEAKEAAINKGIMHNDDYECTIAKYKKLFNRWKICVDGYSNVPFGEFTVGLYA